MTFNPNDTVSVELRYTVDGDDVEYTRTVTRHQLGILLLQFDEMADETEEE